MVDLRERIYEILGLPLGSLSNEGGRDWNEAKKEAEAELRDSFDTEVKRPMLSELSIHKVSDFHHIRFYAINSTLDSLTIDKFIDTNDKDIHLALIRNQKLSSSQKDNLKTNGTYLVKKILKDKE